MYSSKCVISMTIMHLFQLMCELMRPTPEWGPLKRSNRTGIYNAEMLWSQTSYELVDWTGKLYLPQTILLARTPAGSTYNVTSVENYTGQVPVILNVNKTNQRLLRPPGISRQISQSMSDLEVPGEGHGRPRHTSGSVPNLAAAKKSSALAHVASVATRTASSMANVASAMTSHMRTDKASIEQQQPSSTSQAESIV